MHEMISEEAINRAQNFNVGLVHMHYTLNLWSFQHCKCRIQHRLNLFEPSEHTPATMLSPTNLAVAGIQYTGLFNGDYT